jgi:peptide methionine sulfoxide reductase msrA/msrB
MEGQAVIYIAGGCFWGTEHFMKKIHGVIDTTAGYANGRTQNPTYEDVCTNHTGFAETVKVTYDTGAVSLETLLNLYFMTIDPTSLNRQGGDIGSQYRTGIYYVDSHDLDTIQSTIADLEKNYDIPIVIEVKPLENFYPAEDYHQDYLDKNPQGYCHISPELFTMAQQAHTTSHSVKKEAAACRKNV